MAFAEASSKRFAKVLSEIAEGAGDAAPAAKRVERALQSENPWEVAP